MEDHTRGTVVIDTSLLAFPLLDVAGLIVRAHAAMLHQALDIRTLHPRGLRVPQLDREECRDVRRAVERHGWRAAWVLLPSLPFGRVPGDRAAAIVEAATSEPQTPAVFLTVTPVQQPLPRHIHTLRLDLAHDDPSSMLDRAVEKLLSRVEERPW